MIDLKPCPFCGSTKPNFYVGRYNMAADNISCTCGASVSTYLEVEDDWTDEEYEYECKKILATKWNRRAV